MTSTGTADSVTVRGRARVPMAVMPPRMIASSAMVTSRRVSEPAVTATSCRTMAYPMRWTSTVWVPTGTPSTSKDPSLPLRDPMESAAMRTCAPARPWLVASSRTVPAMVPSCAATKVGRTIVRDKPRSTHRGVTTRANLIVKFSELEE